MPTSREELAATIDVAEWDWLRAHLERDGLILVAAGLDLPDVGMKVATDDLPAVKELVDTGTLSKPSLDQIAAWDRNRQKLFRTLIVSPYILIQELS